MNKTLNPPPLGFGQAPIIQKFYDFYRIFHGYLLKFPKTDKHTLGQAIQLHALQLIEIILLSGSTSGLAKKERLTTASAKLDLVKLLIRLAYDVKAIDQKGYIRLQGYLQEIGRMLGGWLRSVQ